ncbi:MAG: glycosyltransferase, partial [Acidobacteria bacterium]|nr:glycosyltransferase [Acidobacteriota bacterium]
MIKNIGIDGFQLNHYGIGTYLRNTLRHLKGVEDQRYFVFCHSNDVSQIEQLNPELIPVKYDNFNYTTADLLKISRHFKKLGLHLFHAVHYITPLFHKLPIIATVHDMLPFEYPGSYTEIERRGTLKNIEKTLQKASAVVSVSKSTK